MLLRAEPTAWPDGTACAGCYRTPASLMPGKYRRRWCGKASAGSAPHDVIPGSGGCRKLRWSRAGTGKRGGVRVIYYNRLDDGTIWLLVTYAKAERGNIPAHILRQVKESL